MHVATAWPAGAGGPGPDSGRKIRATPFGGLAHDRVTPIEGVDFVSRTEEGWLPRCPDARSMDCCCAHAESRGWLRPWSLPPQPQQRAGCRPPTRLLGTTQGRCPRRLVPTPAFLRLTRPKSPKQSPSSGARRRRKLTPRACQPQLKPVASPGSAGQIRAAKRPFRYCVRNSPGFSTGPY